MRGPEPDRSLARTRRVSCRPVPGAGEKSKSLGVSQLANARRARYDLGGHQDNRAPGSRDRPDLRRSLENTAPGPVESGTTSQPVNFMRIQDRGSC